MARVTEFRPTGCGLHPSHYDALRIEILRTGVELSDAQLSDLTEALDRQVRRRRPGGSTRRTLSGTTTRPQTPA